MNNIARVFATGIIWGALTLIAVAMTVSQITLSSSAFVSALIALIIGATVGTLGVWRGAGANTDAREEAQKAKRRSRVERLMSDMDEHDLDELRFRLMGQNEEERVPLEELLQSQKRR